jgi:hypothetical protein
MENRVPDHAGIAQLDNHINQAEFRMHRASTVNPRSRKCRHMP